MTKKMFNQFLCSSLMLPEHRDALNRRRAEQRKKEKMCRPCIDEQQHALWDCLLTAALRQGKELAVYYKNEQGEHLLRGAISRIVPLRREIYIQAAGVVSRVSLDNIVSLEEICGGDEGC